MSKGGLFVASLLVAWSARAGATDCQLNTTRLAVNASGTANTISSDVSSGTSIVESGSSVTLNSGVTLDGIDDVTLQAAPTSTGGSAAVNVEGNIYSQSSIILEGTFILVTSTAYLSCFDGWTISGPSGSSVSLVVDTIAPIAVNGPSLSLAGNAGTLTINSGRLSLQPVVVTSGDVGFAASTSFAVQVNGTGAGEHGELKAGNVDLTNHPALQFNATFTPPLGTSFTIVHAAALSGTFSGLADGALFAVNTDNYQIHYTATDVVVTAVDLTTVTISPSPASSVTGQPVTLVATVTGSSPTGTITFDLDGTLQSPVPLVAGQATLTTSFVASALPSAHISADYSGDADNAASSSGISAYFVNPGRVDATVSPSPCPITVFGQSLHLSSTILPAPPAEFIGPPRCMVDVDGIDGPWTDLTDGTVLSTSSLSIATHAVTVLLGSSGFGVVEVDLICTVLQASTSTALVSSANPSLPGDSVTLTATPSVVAPGAGTLTGTVTFLDGATPVGSPVPLASGAAQIDTGPLAAGTHSFTAQYSGDGNFNGSTSTALMQTVAEANADLSTTLDLSTPPDLAGLDLSTTASANDLSATAPDLSMLSPSASTAGCACNTAGGNARAPWLFLVVLLGFALRRKIAPRTRTTVGGNCANGNVRRGSP